MGNRKAEIKQDRWVGASGKGVMGMKEGTLWREHWVLYATDESLNSTFETNNIPYAN